MPPQDHTAVHPLSPYSADGVDRKNLVRLVDRYRALHAVRLQRWQSQTTDRQRFFMDVVALLIDMNHPLLPGYVGKDCPCRITDFIPLPQGLHELKTFSLSLKWQKNHLAADIHALFLMGSCGTVAQSSDSDLDFWVCVREGLSPQELEQLRNKLDRITSYAATQAIQATFFLVQPELFRRGHSEHLSHEDCGATQHQLLLDEFYRSSLLLAGLYPLWWIVPVKEEANYEDFTRMLLGRRHVMARTVLDLGAVLPVPLQEFVGAGSWQLFKGIDSPYKSVLKMLLAEVYASSHPDVRLLSMDFKQAVFERTVDADALDPYVVLYERVAAYLEQRGEAARLELARQCFYLKTGEALSRPGSARNWRRGLLQRMTDAWGWDAAKLRHLDRLPSWDLRTLLDVQERLTVELHHAWSVLDDYAQRQGVALSEAQQNDLTLLRRRLAVVYAEAPGKIPLLHGLPSGNRRLEEVHLVADASLMSWDILESPQHKGVLFRGYSLIESVVWALVNAVADAGSRWHLQPAVLSRNALQLLLYRLRDAPALQLQDPEDEQLALPAQWTHVAVVLQQQRIADEALHKQGLERVAHDADPLSYGPRQHNYLERIDLIARNSWQEIQVLGYEGADLVPRFLLDVLQHASAHVEWSILQVHPASVAGQLGSRLEHILKQLIHAREQESRPWVYMLRSGSFMHLLLATDTWRSQSVEEGEALYKALRALPEDCHVLADWRSVRSLPLGRFLEGRRVGVLRMAVVRDWFRCTLLLENGYGGLWASPTCDEARMRLLWDRLMAFMGQDREIPWVDLSIGPEVTSFEIELSKAHATGIRTFVVQLFDGDSI